MIITLYTQLTKPWHRQLIEGMSLRRFQSVCWTSWENSLEVAGWFISLSPSGFQLVTIESIFFNDGYRSHVYPSYSKLLAEEPSGFTVFYSYGMLRLWFAGWMNYLVGAFGHLFMKMFEVYVVTSHLLVSQLISLFSIISHYPLLKAVWQAGF